MARTHQRTETVVLTGVLGDAMLACLRGPVQEDGASVLALWPGQPSGFVTSGTTVRIPLLPSIGHNGRHG